jgi:hypothetical protein
MEQSMDILYKAMFSIAGVAIASIVIHFVFHEVFHRSLHSKPVARIIGIIVASLGIFIFITFYSELQEIPIEPERMSIENINPEILHQDRLWVRIRDGTWDCNNMAYSESNTYAVLLNKDETFFIVASFDEEKTCEELGRTEPAGSLSKFVDREFLYTSNFVNFSKYGANVSFLHLCAYCGRENSKLGAVMGIVFMVLGLFYDKVTITMPGNKANTATRPPQPKDLMN